MELTILAPLIDCVTDRVTDCATDRATDCATDRATDRVVSGTGTFA